MTFDASEDQNQGCRSRIGRQHFDRFQGVFNNGYGVNELTRECVVAIATRFNYRPNRVARGFAANDVMALGAVRTDLDRGLRLPEDLSLIGFDNIEFSAIDHPPLTTIHQPKYEMGYAAIEILLRLARDKNWQIPEHRLPGVELTERQSYQEARVQGPIAS